MTVSLDDVVFAFDMSRIEVSGGVRYLWDYGKDGFHMRFPGGAADPTPQLDGSLSFDGGDYLYYDGNLPRFYAKLPTGLQTYTWMAVAGSTVVAADTARVFTCFNLAAGGVRKGLILGYNTATANQRIYAYHFLGGAVSNSCNTAAAEPYVRGTRSVLSLTIETVPRALVNQAANVAAWAGAFGPVVYDAAIVPRIGGDPVGGSYLTGRISYLALLRGSLASSDLALYSRLLAEGTYPFCVRR